MSVELDPLVRRFCRELAEETGYHALQWRSVLLVGVRCRIRAPAILEKIVTRAVRLRWLLKDSTRGVALTEEGLELVRAMPGLSLRRWSRDKSRLSC
jgi:hypothetical protein